MIENLHEKTYIDLTVIDSQTSKNKPKMYP